MATEQADVPTGAHRQKTLHEWLIAPSRHWMAALALPVLLALVPPALLVWAAVGGGDTPFQLLSYPIASVPIEREIASSLDIARLVPPDPRLPLWERVPPQGAGLFTVYDSTARARLNGVLADLQRYDDGAVNGTLPAPDEVQRMRAILSEFIAGQAKDRVPALYARAVLAIWTGAFTSAVTDLTRSENLIQQSGVAGSERGMGALIAIRYLRGLAKLKDMKNRANAHNTNEDDLRKIAADAKGDFAVARDAASGLAKNAKIGMVGPFFRINSTRHMVELNTSKIWLGYLLAVDEADGPREAAKEAQPLFDEATYLGNEPLLASELALLAAEQGNPSAVDALTNAAGDHTRVGAVDAGRFNTAARVLALLNIAGKVDRDNPNDTGALREKFRQIYPGTPLPFPRMEFGPDKVAGDRLDDWLYFRQWHGDLERGQLKEMFDGMAELQRSKTDLEVFGTWRNQVLDLLGPQLLRRAGDGATTNSEDALAIYHFLAAHPFPYRIRAYALLRIVFGHWWWLALILYPMFVAFCGWLALSLIDYRRLFRSLHYEARQKAMGGA